ncbi:exodeoxyribonuclease III [Streptomyces sp. AD16]|nr:exodeoxyribonuclease III [Streptomyces sp. AD16]
MERRRDRLPRRPRRRRRRPARRPRLRRGGGAPGDLRDLRPGPRLVGLRAERPRGRPPHFAYKLQWLKALRDAVADDAAGDRPFAVLGDYNIAPHDSDVWDPTAFIGATHVTPEERETLAALRATGLDDVVPRPLKYDQPFTYWDYRQLGFPKNRGMRIDLVYGNDPFRSAVSDAYVDREERKGKGASDHAPVVTDLTV